MINRSEHKSGNPVNRIAGRRSSVYWSAFVLILMTTMGLNSLTGAAQRPNQWPAQQRVPGFGDEALPPRLIADQNRTVHAFTHQQVGDDGKEVAIVYSQWTLEEGWATPVDILLSPIKHQARVVGAILDQAGIMHVAYFGGDDLEANMYYSHAPALEAARAPAWSKPVTAAEKAITPTEGALVGDNQGNMAILYSGNIDGSGLYAVYSSDGGKTWSDPVAVFLTYSDSHKVFGLQTHMGKSGNIYAVWFVVDDKGHNVSGHYARLNLADRQWSDPIEIAEGIGIDVGMGVSYPDVIEYNDEVFVMYNNGIPPDGVPPAQWVRRSSDGGRTWSEPVRPFARHVGRNGFSSFAIDNNNTLHVLFSERIPLEGIYAIHGVWHSVWQGDRWGEAEPVVSGAPVEGFDPYDVRAVISQGNALLVTWRTDPGKARNGVWFSYTVLDAPELPVAALPTVPATPTPTSVRTATPSVPTPTPTLRPAFVDHPVDTSAQSFLGGNPAAPFIIGITPALLLMLTIIVRYRLERHRSRR